MPKKRKRKRRFFSEEQKRRLLSEYDSLTSQADKQAFRKKHDLSTFHFSQWRTAGHGNSDKTSTGRVVKAVSSPSPTKHIEEGSPGVQTALEFLRTQESRLRGQYEAAKETAQNLKSEIARIKKAIAALNGQTTPRRRSPSKDSPPTSEELVPLIERLLKEHSQLKEPDLREKLNQLLELEDRSRKGVHFTFKAAIRDDRFLWNGARWTLRHEAKQSG